MRREGLQHRAKYIPTLRVMRKRWFNAFLPQNPCAHALHFYNGTQRITSIILVWSASPIPLYCGGRKEPASEVHHYFNWQCSPYYDNGGDGDRNLHAIRVSSHFLRPWAVKRVHMCRGRILYNTIRAWNQNYYLSAPRPFKESEINH